MRGFMRQCCCIVAVICVVAAAHAAPPVFTYQGALTDASGNPANGLYGMTFSMYVAATGGGPSWTQTIPTVQVQDGIFTVLLGGSAAPLPAGLVGCNFLEVAVGGTPMVPRQRVTSVPFALESADSDKLVGQPAAFYRDASNLNAGTIREARLPQDAIDSTEIQDESILRRDIANAAISAPKLAGSSVITVKIRDGAVTGDKIAPDALGPDQIGPDAVGASELADDAVDEAALQNGAVTTDKIDDDAVTLAKVADNAVGSPQIVNGSVGPSDLAGGAVIAGKIGSDAVGFKELADDAVDTAAIQDDAVTTAKIDDDTIGSADVGPDAVGASELANNAVDTGALQTDAVTTAKIDDDTIGSSDIGPNAVEASELANNAVDTAAIQDGAVTGPKIQFGAEMEEPSSGWGLRVINTTTGATGCAIYGKTDSAAASVGGGYGVCGQAYGGGKSCGVIGSAQDGESRGVYGTASGGTSTGVFAYANTAGAVALRAQHNLGTEWGLRVEEGKSYFEDPVEMNNTLDVSGTATLDGNAVVSGTLDVTGLSAFNSNLTINAKAKLLKSFGSTPGTVYGLVEAENTMATAGWSAYAVEGSIVAQSGAAVYGAADNTTTGATSHGVEAHTNAPNGAAVKAAHASSSGYGLWVDEGKTQLDGTLDVNGYATFHGGHGDLAENYRAADVEAADVVVIGDGGELVKCTRERDTTVAGIVSTQPSMKLQGRIDDGEGVAPLALVGRVLCKVDATERPIKAGDLLTTSSTPGHAMKARSARSAAGAIIGKALEDLESGTGRIQVLVTLR